MELLLGFMGVSLLLHIYYINRMRVLRDWIEIVDNRIDYYEKQLPDEESALQREYRRLKEKDQHERND